MKSLALIANFAWATTNLHEYAAFRRALHTPRAVQEKLLNLTLVRNAGTVFGIQNHFAGIRSIETFRNTVPIRNFDDFSPWIDRIASGEHRVLTTEPVSRLIPSSGTTRAAKLVPYTDGFQHQLNRAIGPWIVDLFTQQPALMAGPAYWSITPMTQPSVSSARVPIGYSDDAEYLGGLRKKLIESVMAVPKAVVQKADEKSFRKIVARRLLASRDLRLISVWHPSFMELLLDEIATQAGHDDWKRIWPKLNLISCWADAHAAGPAEALAKRMPQVLLQPKGLLATEAFISIPFAGRWPLAIRSHFFEFENHGALYCADELKIGTEYGVIVTTAAGLCRLRLGDTVRCEGFVGKTPSIRFVGRQDMVVDRFGEKLNENFVGHTIRRWLAEIGLSARFAMLAPDHGGYALFIDASDISPDAAASLDSGLCENPHYAYCRQLGQLSLVRIVRINDGYAKYTTRLQHEGMRLGDIKPVSLDRRDGWENHFLNPTNIYFST